MEWPSRSGMVQSGDRYRQCGRRSCRGREQNIHAAVYWRCGPFPQRRRRWAFPVTKRNGRPIRRGDQVMKLTAAASALTLLLVVQTWADDTSAGRAKAATGPLSVCPNNHRYFADATGKPVYLTGSHTWANFATD